MIKLGKDHNSVFRSKIGDRVNMIHLFFKTAGFYNPFLDDKTLRRYAPKKNWIFSVDDGNHRMFVKNLKGFDLHCITPVSFCRSVGLSEKVEFNSETAILFLAGLLYHGSSIEVRFPNKDVLGYLGMEIDPDDGEVLSHAFQSVEFTEEEQIRYDRVVRINSLEYFCLTRDKSLGLAVLDSNRLFKILKEAKIVDRGDRNG
jgi:hypothetical protein